ncbi:ELMO domain-containing protein 1 [Porphyridium purpureum]|uniref:ELMO domain-containing protein 1 n=1 Tax=Porphyridium purpureum TaxID=35688 RepID=A0A5J4YTX7_PORPP|nr:ELMO domain-containing protein 1 [Porphyridium purpureum]|eukprot:POR2618..scf227_4
MVQKLAHTTRHLQRLAKHPFESVHAGLEHSVGQVWSLLVHGQEWYNGWLSLAWSRIGFHGKHPATTSHGAGLLGLLELRYFTELGTSLTQRALMDPEADVSPYPFAYCSIWMAAKLGKAVKRYLLSAIIFESSVENAALGALQELGELRAKFLIDCHS